MGTTGNRRYQGQTMDKFLSFFYLLSIVKLIILFYFRYLIHDNDNEWQGGNSEAIFIELKALSKELPNKFGW